MDDDLVAFVGARLDEDERTATAATQGDWVWSREFVTPPGYHHRTIGPLEPGDAAHIARHDPARVLAEAAAKRELVQVAESQPDQVAYMILAPVASVYRDHPDFKTDWLE